MCLASGVLLNNILDHFPVITITLHPYIESKVPFLYNNEKIENFNIELNDIEWQNILSVIHPHSDFNNFLNEFN